MHRIRYKGGRTPLELKLNYLDNEYTFVSSESVVDMTDSDAIKLLERNPRGYEIVEYVKDAPKVVESTIMDIGETIQTELGGGAETVVEVPESKPIFKMTKDELEIFAKEEFGVDIDKRMSRANLLRQVNDLKKERDAAAEEARNEENQSG